MTSPELRPIEWVKANGLYPAVRKIVDAAPVDGPADAIAMVRAMGFPEAAGASLKAAS